MWVFCGNIFRKTLGRSGLSVSHVIGGYGPFKLDAMFAFSNFSSWGSDQHNDGFKDCVKMCRDKACVFDIGAHIGLTTLPIASVLADGGLVVSFEPSDANRRYLSHHVRRNGLSDLVRLEGVLVGESDSDRVDFYESDDVSGMNSAAEVELGEGYRSVARCQVSIDSYCAKHNLEPQVIKIDVEGAEIAVLRGAKNTLRRAQPIIFLSYHPRHVSAFGFTQDDLIETLEEVGYDYRHVDGSQVEQLAFREYVLTPRQEN